LNEHKDDILQDELSGLTVGADFKELNKADTEAKVVVSKAKREEMRKILIMDQGRCPSCHSKTETFLLTTVCTNCSWFRTTNAGQGEVKISLLNKEVITCNYIHRGKDMILCIRDGVLVAEVLNSQIFKIEHLFTDEELEIIKEKTFKLSGVCCWCEKPLIESEEGGPYIDLVAFGLLQERYVFCSEKCQKSFRRQYVPRIHRNCYETDCNECNLCVKRFDSKGIKRNILK